jgi:hypothetical protein
LTFGTLIVKKKNEKGKQHNIMIKQALLIKFQTPMELLRSPNFGTSPLARF